MKKKIILPIIGMLSLIIMASVALAINLSSFKPAKDSRLTNLVDEFQKNDTSTEITDIARLLYNHTVDFISETIKRANQPLMAFPIFDELDTDNDS